MNTGWNVFHGARTSDVHNAAKALQHAKSISSPSQILAGAGYSMGAIILANYAARYGQDCALDAAVSVSGGLNMREQLTFYRSMRLWQPMLAQSLREVILTGFQARYEKRLSDDDFREFQTASHVSVSFQCLCWTFSLNFEVLY